MALGPNVEGARFGVVSGGRARPARRGEGDPLEHPVRPLDGADEVLARHAAFGLGEDRTEGRLRAADIQRVGDLDHALAVAAGVDPVQNQLVAAFVADGHVGMARGHDQTAVSGAHHLAGDLDPAAGEVHLVEHDGLLCGIPDPGERNRGIRCADGAESDARDAAVFGAHDGGGRARRHEARGYGHRRLGHARLDQAVDVEIGGDDGHQPVGEDGRLARGPVPLGYIAAVGAGEAERGEEGGRHPSRRGRTDGGVAAVRLDPADERRRNVTHRRPRVRTGVIPVGRDREIAARGDVDRLRQDLPRHPDRRIGVCQRGVAQIVDDRTEDIEVGRQVRQALPGVEDTGGAQRAFEGSDIVVAVAVAGRDRDRDAGAFVGILVAVARDTGVVDVDIARIELGVVARELAEPRDLGVLDHHIADAVHHVEVGIDVDLHVPVGQQDRISPQGLGQEAGAHRLLRLDEDRAGRGREVGDRDEEGLERLVGDEVAVRVEIDRHAQIGQLLHDLVELRLIAHDRLVVGRMLLHPLAHLRVARRQKRLQPSDGDQRHRRGIGADDHDLVGEGAGDVDRGVRLERIVGRHQHAAAGIHHHVSTVNGAGRHPLPPGAVVVVLGVHRHGHRPAGRPADEAVIGPGDALGAVIVDIALLEQHHVAGEQIGGDRGRIPIADLVDLVARDPERVAFGLGQIPLCRADRRGPCLVRELFGMADVIDRLVIDPGAQASVVRDVDLPAFGVVALIGHVVAVGRHGQNEHRAVMALLEQPVLGFEEDVAGGQNPAVAGDVHDAVAVGVVGLQRHRQRDAQRREAAVRRRARDGRVDQTVGLARGDRNVLAFDEAVGDADGGARIGQRLDVDPHIGAEQPTLEDRRVGGVADRGAGLDIDVAAVVADLGPVHGDAGIGLDPLDRGGDRNAQAAADGLHLARVGGRDRRDRAQSDLRRVFVVADANDPRVSEIDARRHLVSARALLADIGPRAENGDVAERRGGAGGDVVAGQRRGSVAGDDRLFLDLVDGGDADRLAGHDRSVRGVADKINCRVPQCLQIDIRARTGSGGDREGVGGAVDEPIAPRRDRDAGARQMGAVLDPDIGGHLVREARFRPDTDQTATTARRRFPKGVEFDIGLQGDLACHDLAVAGDADLGIGLRPGGAVGAEAGLDDRLHRTEGPEPGRHPDRRGTQPRVIGRQRADPLGHVHVGVVNLGRNQGVAKRVRLVDDRSHHADADAGGIDPTDIELGIRNDVGVTGVEDAIRDPRRHRAGVAAVHHRRPDGQPDGRGGDGDVGDVGLHVHIFGRLNGQKPGARFELTIAVVQVDFGRDLVRDIERDLQPATGRGETATGQRDANTREVGQPRLVMRLHRDVAARDDHGPDGGPALDLRLDGVGDVDLQDRHVDRDGSQPDRGDGADHRGIRHRRHVFIHRGVGLRVDEDVARRGQERAFRQRLDRRMVLDRQADARRRDAAADGNRHRDRRGRDGGAVPLDRVCGHRQIARRVERAARHQNAGDVVAVAERVAADFAARDTNADGAGPAADGAGDGRRHRRDLYCGIGGLRCRKRDVAAGRVGVGVDVALGLQPRAGDDDFGGIADAVRAVGPGARQGERAEDVEGDRNRRGDGLGIDLGRVGGAGGDVAADGRNLGRARRGGNTRELGGRRHLGYEVAPGADHRVGCTSEGVIGDLDAGVAVDLVACQGDADGDRRAEALAGDGDGHGRANGDGVGIGIFGRQRGQRVGVQETAAAAAAADFHCRIAVDAVAHIRARARRRQGDETRRRHGRADGVGVAEDLGGVLGLDPGDAVHGQRHIFQAGRDLETIILGADPVGDEGRADGRRAAALGPAADANADRDHHGGDLAIVDRADIEIADVAVDRAHLGDGAAGDGVARIRPGTGEADADGPGRAHGDGGGDGDRHDLQAFAAAARIVRQSRDPRLAGHVHRPCGAEAGDARRRFGVDPVVGQRDGDADRDAGLAGRRNRDRGAAENGGDLGQVHRLHIDRPGMETVSRIRALDLGQHPRLTTVDRDGPRPRDRETEAARGGNRDRGRDNDGRDRLVRCGVNVQRAADGDGAVMDQGGGDEARVFGEDLLDCKGIGVIDPAGRVVGHRYAERGRATLGPRHDRDREAHDDRDDARIARCRDRHVVDPGDRRFVDHCQGRAVDRVARSRTAPGKAEEARGRCHRCGDGDTDDLHVVGAAHGDVVLAADATVRCDGARQDGCGFARNLVDARGETDRARAFGPAERHCDTETHRRDGGRVAGEDAEIGLVLEVDGRIAETRHDRAVDIGDRDAASDRDGDL